MELDAGSVSDSGFASFGPKGILESIPDLFQMFPGIDEALSFAELIQSVQSMKYSVIIFDTAPTGHTLKFLNLPDLLDKLVDTLLKVESFFGVFMRMLSLVNSQTSRGEMFEKVKELKSTITLTMEQMKNPDLTTFVCVCIPEFLSVYETERLVQYLARNDIDCSYIIINQILNYFDLGDSIIKAQNSLDDIKEETREIFRNLLELIKEQQSMLKGRVSIQKKYIDDIKELYDNYFNIVAIPQYKDEVRGSEAIKEFSKILLEHSPIPF
ncbi:arsenical pump-driving ATPase, putative [Theileria equi strain WA]|uniref:Arsenical pump-driving ATPase, putative n=1 Tax=Theileria equi strain WA TaxID=1537102 RepID=L1LAK4_THEEQ|nr:arsenical pump-driving ATPase, putative [Theileria equi strain WA]EKX72346.1 arsenical pump-driving ATPase, putative [Theileria equi strain WA]|eukprot:XP_004831798.1 arsenical pump-driving ATPase, putative [Theileria equi strain WA]